MRGPIRWLALVGVAICGTMVGCFLPPNTTAVGNNVFARSITSAGDDIVAIAVTGDGRIFFAERKTGRIRVIIDGELLDTPIVDLPVNSFGARGLLDIALGPDFASTGRLYAFYSRADTGADSTLAEAIVDHRVVMFELDDNATTGGEALITSIPHGEVGSRIGGQIAFSPDGALFVALGDFARPEVVQDANTVWGKLLRYNADGSVPSDNPLTDSPVYATGLRLPTGIAFDPFSAEAFVVDQSDPLGSEINRIIPAGNFGWPEVIGPADLLNELAFVASEPNFVSPIFYDAVGRALIGLTVNPSSAYGPDVARDLFYADRDPAQIYNLPLADDRLTGGTEMLFAGNLPQGVRDLTFTNAGTLYVASRSEILILTSNPRTPD